MIQDKSKSYRNEEFAYQRLLKEKELYKKLIIAFDFDDTIFDLHEQNLFVDDVINLLKKAKEQGHILCMWTALPDQWSLAYKKSILNTIGIIPDYINESPIMNDSRKPHFSILLDDRAGLGSAYEVLKRVLE
jgi:hypothetical protein